MPVVDIAPQLWKYIEVYYGGDTDAFAADVGQSKHTIYSYTAGKSKPGFEKIVEWVEAGMSPLWLIKDIGPMRWDVEEAEDVELAPIGPPERSRIIDLDEDDAISRIAAGVKQEIREFLQAEFAR